MVAQLLTLGFLLWAFSLNAEASPLSAACEALVKGNHEQTRKCVNHAEFYELNAAFINACSSFSKDLEIRDRCLKSGANLEILNLCRNTGWSTKGTLSCLRSYPTKDSLSACKKIGRDEEEQIRCVRLGREAGQVAACSLVSEDQALQFECLEKDIPAQEAQRCGTKQNADKMNCLEGVVAEREGEYRKEQNFLRGRSVASEKLLTPQPKALQPKK